MAKWLGTSWVASQGEVGRYDVEVSSLLAGAAVLLGTDAIGLLFSHLTPYIERADLRPKPGRIISHGSHSEAGLFVNLGPTEGAVVAARCMRAATVVTLTVGRSSPLLRSFMWTALGVALLCGLLIAKVVLPAGWEPRLSLLVGLGLGVVIAVGIFAALGKRPWLARGRSQEVAERLDRCVRAWIEATEEQHQPRREKPRESGAPESPA